jgi:hypothetical protein
MTPDRDIVLLHRLLDLLEPEHEAPSFKVEKLYDLLFERPSTESRTWHLSDVSKWGNAQISNALGVVKEIVVHYVRLLQDPHSIPVTHYKRQKRVAIHLDEQFALLLRAAAERSGALEWMTDEERGQKDSFLDEPILFLKQEARKKGFPRVKKGGGVSLKALQERYETKLSDRGVRPLPASDWVQPGP